MSLITARPIRTRTAEPAAALAIGNTPLMPLRQFAAAHGLPETIDIRLKAEWTNPGGSIKDRPALAMVLAALDSGELDEGRHQFIFQGLRASMEELGERQQALQIKKAGAETTSADGPTSPTPLPDSARIRVLCLPAHDEADEVAGLMLAQLVETRECLVHVVPIAALVSEMSDLVEQHQADVVCISATPPAAVMNARHVCKHLRVRFPKVPLVVGLWDAKGDLSKAKERIGGDAATYVVSTLAAAQQQIRLLTQPLRLRSEKLEQSADYRHI